MANKQGKPRRTHPMLDWDCTCGNCEHFETVNGAWGYCFDYRPITSQRTRPTRSEFRQAKSAACSHYEPKANRGAEIA